MKILNLLLSTLLVALVVVPVSAKNPYAMADGDRDADAYKLIEGDKVTVAGVIDDDLFEGRELVADTVTVLLKNYRPESSR